MTGKKKVVKDSGLKLRKVGRRSKVEKKFQCPLCPAKCASKTALRHHNRIYHLATEAERAVITQKARSTSKTHNAKIQLGSHSKAEKEKLDVFTGDITQKEPIDDEEEEFMRLARKERGNVKSYYKYVIIVVPAEVTEENLDAFFSSDNSQQCSAYMGTSVESGGCDIHQLVDARGNTSSVVQMLEEDEDGNNKYIAYMLDIEVNTGISYEINQKEAYKWESFHTYAAAGQRRTKAESFKVVYLNQSIESVEGVRGGLTEEQILRARRLGRSGYNIIGTRDEFEGIQIRFPLRDEQGQLLFRRFTSELVPQDEPDNGEQD